VSEDQAISNVWAENVKLRDERDRLTKEYVRLFRLGEPIAKMLSELSILPIGCSREQELAWKMAVKNFRHYQRDYAADVLLQAALTPAAKGGDDD
jgi:hypothetical protein